MKCPRGWAACGVKQGDFLRRGHWREGLKEVGTGPRGYLEKSTPGRGDNQCKGTLAGVYLRFSRSNRKAVWLQQRVCRGEPGGEVRWDQAQIVRPLKAREGLGLLLEA